ncbi:Uncharacterised protein [Mycobacteroides abscessus subsp. abscessus]|nr:Uncharacterised protein [Mycobacteroides abscessus subsp. abscessus]
MRSSSGPPARWFGTPSASNQKKLIAVRMRPLSGISGESTKSYAEMRSLATMSRVSESI